SRPALPLPAPQVAAVDERERHDERQQAPRPEHESEQEPAGLTGEAKRPTERTLRPGEPHDRDRVGAERQRDELSHDRSSVGCPAPISPVASSTTWPSPAGSPAGASVASITPKSSRVRGRSSSSTARAVSAE